MAICDYLSSLHADCVFDSPMQDFASVLYFPISTDLEGVPQDPGQQFSIQYQYSLTSVNLHNYLNPVSEGDEWEGAKSLEAISNMEMKQGKVQGIHCYPESRTDSAYLLSGKVMSLYPMHRG